MSKSYFPNLGDYFLTIGDCEALIEGSNLWQLDSRVLFHANLHICLVNIQLEIYE